MVWDGEEFAQRLRIAMARQGVRSKELASKADVSYSKISRLLNVRPTAPSVPELQAIADALDVPLAELVPDATIENGATSEAGGEVAELVARLRTSLMNAAEIVALLEAQLPPGGAGEARAQSPPPPPPRHAEEQ